jgi:hypothetical protein
MPSYLPSRSKAKSLTAQIRDAEHQVLNRQRGVTTRAGTLARHIRQQLTAPASLLLASGIGFILAELTKCQNRKSSSDTGEKNLPAETSPLRIALNLLASVRTLYTALPLAWMLKSFYRPSASGQTPKIRVARKTRSRQPIALRHRNAP